MRCPGYPDCEPALTRRRWLRALGSLLGAQVGILGLGCAALPPRGLKPPVLSFREIGIRQAGLDQIRFTLIVDAHNPNEIDLPIRELNGALDLAGNEIARATAQESAFVLPGGGTRQLPLDISVRTVDLLALLRRLAGSAGSATAYRLAGSAKWGDSPFAIAFERKGSIDLIRALSRATSRH